MDSTEIVVAIIGSAAASSLVTLPLSAWLDALRANREARRQEISELRSLHSDLLLSFEEACRDEEACFEIVRKRDEGVNVSLISPAGSGAEPQAHTGDESPKSRFRRAVSRLRVAEQDRSKHEALDQIRDFFDFPIEEHPQQEIDFAYAFPERMGKARVLVNSIIDTPSRG